jgi:hypothetical protein
VLSLGRWRQTGLNSEARCPQQGIAEADGGQPRLASGSGRQRLDGGSFSEWRRSRAAGGSSGGRSGAAVEASEDRNGAVASRQVAAAAKQVTTTWQLTVAAAAMARMQPGARGGRRGGGAAAWPRVASAVTRQPARSVSRLVL